MDPWFLAGGLSEEQSWPSDLAEKCRKIDGITLGVGGSIYRIFLVY